MDKTSPAATAAITTITATAASAGRSQRRAGGGLAGGPTPGLGPPGGLAGQPTVSAGRSAATVTGGVNSPGLGAISRDGPAMLAGPRWAARSGLAGACWRDGAGAARRTDPRPSAARSSAANRPQLG